MRKTLLILLLPSIIFSQEVLTELSSNPSLLNVNLGSNNSKSVLNLPFMDDFFYDSPVVDNDLWEQSSVFVNRTYPINPPTIGVATFDGLDEYGLARGFSQSNPSEPSDTLLSQAIDLSAIDSAYFLFFYQPKGIGDNPQIGDSLILEFKNMNGDWDMVWHNICDTIISEFTKEVIILKSSDYLTSFFQLRFRNYATISGNFDHWHIDYIKIDEFVNQTDTIELNDVSFVYNSPSFLKRYSAMPWTHFLNYEVSELEDSIDIILRNNNASINVDYQYNVFEDNNQIYHYPTTGVSRNVSVLDYDSIGNFSFANPPIDIQSNVFTSFQPSDTTTFIVKNIINTALSDNKLNDTLNHIQNFHYYFSYDDGIAESAYGINVNGAKLAYEFKLNRPDTLRAVQMYFPQMLDTVSDVPFKLTIWDNISGLGDIIHQQDVSPVHTENGAFHTYYLDSLFQIVGTFYVGWEQTTNDLLNIGFDKNNEANQYMYYNVGSGWTTSAYPGSWMIRPIVSMEQITSTVSDVKSSFKIYPNPSSEIIIIETQNDRNQISIFNIQGVLVIQQMTSNIITKVNVSNLSPSVYFVEVTNENGKQYKKIIVK